MCGLIVLKHNSFVIILFNFYQERVKFFSALIEMHFSSFQRYCSLFHVFISCISFTLLIESIIFIDLYVMFID